MKSQLLARKHSVTAAFVMLTVFAACGKTQAGRTSATIVKSIDAGSQQNSDAPRNLRGIQTSGNQVYLTWLPPSAGQKSQRVERSENQNDWTSFQDLDAASFETTDASALAPSLMYYYRVVAVFEDRIVPSNVILLQMSDKGSTAPIVYGPVVVASATPTPVPPVPTDVVILPTPTPTVGSPSSNTMTVTGMSPDFGWEGTVVTLTGTNLRQATLVNMSGTLIQISSATDATLSFKIPAGMSIGAVPALQMSSGDYISAGYYFYIPPAVPVISSIYPTSGPAQTIVTIYGQHMMQVERVFIGNMEAIYITRSNEWVTVQIPFGAVSGNLGILANGSTLQMSAPPYFSVTQ